MTGYIQFILPVQGIPKYAGEQSNIIYCVHFVPKVYVPAAEAITRYANIHKSVAISGIAMIARPN